MKYAKINKLEYIQLTDEDYNIPYAYVEIEVELLEPETPNEEEDPHLFDYIKASFDDLSNIYVGASSKDFGFLEVHNQEHCMSKTPNSLVYSFIDHVSDTPPLGLSLKN